MSVVRVSVGTVIATVPLSAAASALAVDEVSGDALATTYREVEDVARRIANARGLELVLFYNDVVTEADFYTPQTLQRKLSQPGALVPMAAQVVIPRPSTG